jgi:hypothetical protein
MNHLKHTMKKISIILLFTAGIFLISSGEVSAQVSVGVSISANIAPPVLPVYSQPPCPTDGFLWTPGYWAYGDGGYFWVPGVWVRPPQAGFLWTPCYWGYAGGIYGFHAGYWGPHVGFYGGVNYGYGYGGSGFGGGRWEGGAFRYNTAVVNVNTTVIHNTYVDRTVIVNHNTTRTSFNGGPGGIAARPTAQEQSFSRKQHIQATAQQTSHMQTASRDRNQFASANNGRPSTTAMNTVGGHRYNSQGNAHAVNNNPASVHQNGQSAPNVHAANAYNSHPSQPHQQS